ncbi:pirin family protein [Oscillatoriales cyanobacterium LEGE 11467]|uniref:Pirin family protein n=1 Tax=Zarconia navalis LEGE 11467 TaxID=1828826 RepID=A0A928VZW2_9CYAN|nr:pirin family protein [Zarconia navalis]MBE9040730.1 pirin family protein [Zarconia navalis LEGE 11467]
MITLRKSQERGHASYDWLNSYHTFSFANYYDPQHMGFRSLRVINDDRVRGGAGFGTHPHRDMEIISYIVEGALEHQDSMGNRSIIRSGEVQRMTAGTGVTHSEYNHSPTDEVRFLQIWIPPTQKGLAPSYEQRQYSAAEKQGAFRLIVSPDGRDKSLSIHQNICLYSTILKAGETLKHSLFENFESWVQVVNGEMTLNDIEMRTGDGAAIENETQLELTAKQDTEVLLFEL